MSIAIWFTYAVNLATPGLRDRAGHLKGSDFLHFYTLGSLVIEGRGNALYDAKAQVAESLRRVPQSAGDAFVPAYGPQVALFFAPFAPLPYLWAWLAWVLVSTFIYGLCCYAVWRTCPALGEEGPLAAVLAAGYPGFFNLVAHGQTSALALGLFTVAFLALRSHRLFLAGLALGSLIYKPQLGIVAALVVLLAQQWRIMAGALAAGIGQLAVAWVCLGSGVMTAYGRTVLSLGRVAPLLEPKLYQMHSLRSFWLLLLPWPVLAMLAGLVTALLVCVAAVLVWRADRPLSLRYAVLLVSTVLVAPHLTVYDLVILAPALLLLGDWVVANPHHRSAPTIAILLYLCYLLPLFGPLARVTHLQLSVVAFGLLLMETANLLRPFSGQPQAMTAGKTTI